VKKFWFIVLAIIIVTGIFLISCGEPEGTTKAPQVLIRMTTPIPPGDEFITWAQEGMDKFNARTNGAYKMQLFPGGQLAPFPESLDVIRTGAVEGGMIPLAAFGGIVPEFGLAELPFLFNNDEANQYAAAGIMKVYDPLLETKANQKSLGCFSVGTLNILSTKKPIKTLEDMKGLIVGCDAPPMTGLINGLASNSGLAAQLVRYELLHGDWRKLFEYLTDDDNCDFERGPLEKIAAEGEMMVYTHDGSWACMDTYRDMEYLNRLWQSKRAFWKVWD